MEGVVIVTIAVVLVTGNYNENLKGHIIKTVIPIQIHEITVPYLNKTGSRVADGSLLPLFLLLLRKGVRCLSPMVTTQRWRPHTIFSPHMNPYNSPSGGTDVKDERRRACKIFQKCR